MSGIEPVSLIQNVGEGDIQTQDKNLDDTVVVFRLEGRWPVTGRIDNREGLDVPFTIGRPD